MTFTKTQYSFAGGEISAGLYGRSDLEKHATAFASGKNAIVSTDGALSKRSGLLHIANTKYAGKRVYLAKFVFSRTECFVLEFGDAYLRVAGENGYVLKNGIPYEIPTPYKPEDLSTLQYVQSADVVFLGCKGYPPKMLTRYANDDWQLTDYANKNGPFEIDSGDRAALTKQDDGTLLMTQLGGTQFTAQDAGGYFKLERDFEAASFNFEQKDATTATTLLGNIFPCCGSWQLNSSGSWTGTVRLEYSADGQTWKEYRSYSSVYSGAGTGANINASGEISGSLKLLRLNASGWSSGTCYLSFRTNLFTYNIFGTVNSVVDSKSAVVQLTNLPAALYDKIGAAVTYTPYTQPAMTGNHAPEGEAFFNTPAFSGAVTNEDGSACETGANAWKAFDGQTATCARVPVYQYADGPKLGRLFGAKKLLSSVTVSGGTVGQALTAYVYAYNASSGWKEVCQTPVAANSSMAFTASFAAVAADGLGVAFRKSSAASEGETETLFVEVSAVNAAAMNIAYGGVEMKYFAPAWGKAKGWPYVLAMHQGRLVWPDMGRVWTSKIDDFNNFEVSLTVTDDDAISANVKDGGLNTAVAAVSMQKLVLLTDGGEFVSSADVLTPKACGFLKQSNYGSAPIRPVVIGSRVLFVELMGGRIRDLQYDYSTDNWQADDICALAPHLFEGRQIVAWDYQPAPQGVLWVVTDDGSLLAAAYERVHNLLAWTHIETDGKVEDVCVIPSQRESAVILAVNRFGSRRLEKFAPRIQGTNLAGQVFLDAAKQFSFASAQTVLSGLDHLEGKTVRVLADGEDQGHFTVTDGQIALKTPAGTAVAGLDYTFEFISLPAVADTQYGEDLGKMRLVRLVTGLEKSKGGEAGTVTDGTDPMNYSQDGVLFTGETEQTVESASRRGLQARIVQRGPWPFKITKLIQELKR